MGLTTDLAGELKRLQGEVRLRPDDAKLRTYLFQLFAVIGDWQRAALRRFSVATSDS